MMDKYCPQELTLICTTFVANETEKVEKYISGLSDNIYGNSKSARPKTLDEIIELANDLMDQKLRTYAERSSGNTNVANAQRDNKAIPKGNVGNAEKKGNASRDPDSNVVTGSGYHQKDRKPSQNDKTEHGMEKTVQNQGQSPKMPKSESILMNQQSNRSRN
ncbi:hypothetical protein Tco_0768079 [Tanacetum coccineum]